jgi:hypothetical protein
MSSQPDTSRLPSDLEGLRNLIAQLNDDLAVQRTIYASLKDLPPDPEVEDQVSYARTEVQRIQQRLSEARRAQYHGVYHSQLLRTAG